MKQEKIRIENKIISLKDKLKKKEGFNFKVLFDDGRLEYLKELPKDQKSIKQIFPLYLIGEA